MTTYRGRQEVHEVSEPECGERKNSVTERDHCDENTWDKLAAEKVRQGKKAELERLRKMGVHQYVNRGGTLNDEAWGGGEREVGQCRAAGSVVCLFRISWLRRTVG